MKKTYSLILAGILITGLLSSCRLIEDTDKIITPDWEPELALPLVNTDLTLQEIIDFAGENKYITIDQDGLISLSYSAEVVSFTAADIGILKLPNIPVPMFDTAQSVPFPIDEISKITLESGYLAYDIESETSGNYELILRLENAVKDGNPFEAVIPFSSPANLIDSVSLAGYDLIFTDGTVDIYYSLRNTATGEKTPASQAFLSLERLKYNYAEGVIGTYDITSAVDTIPIEMVQDIKDARIALTNPSISFSFENSFGIPIEVAMPTFDGETSDNGTVSLGHQGLKDGIVIEYPRLNEVGKSYSTTIDIHKDNSNIVELISSLPQAINYQFGLTANPEGNANTYGFINDSSHLAIGVDIRVPLEGYVGGLTFEKTMNLDIAQIDMAGAGGFKLITENGLPLDVALQAYFVDANGVMIDSLFEAPETFFRSPELNPDGSVQSPGIQTIEVFFPEERFLNIFEATHLKITGNLATASGGTVPVRLSASDGLGIKLGVTAKVKTQ